MNYAHHWRKAMTVSLCLHMFLLAAAGYLAAGLAAPVPAKEMLLEMDLINSPVAEHPVSSPLPEPAPAVVDPVPTELPAAPVITPNDPVMTEFQPASAPAAAQSQAAGNALPAAPPSSGGTRNGSIVAPGILSKVEPVYPASARQAGQEGTVVLRIEIQANGRPGDISIIRSSGYPLLDEAAVASLRSWRFIPAKDVSSGRTVACTTTLPVSFRLR